MLSKNLFDQITENLDTVLKEDSPLGMLLWQEFIKLHPADIALFFDQRDKYTFKRIFTKFSDDSKVEVFRHLSYLQQTYILSFLEDKERSLVLQGLHINELTDLFDELSDEELKKYLKLLHKKSREKVISLMQFESDTAGGIMDTDVISLMQDFTIEKSIVILQKLQPKRELYERIYITNQEQSLVGYIKLEDLVLKNSKLKLSAILNEVEFVADAYQDREFIAKQMLHYSLTTVPVVGEGNIFLGVIPSDTLAEIIEEEAAEDIYKISALRPIKTSYFETPFFTLVYQRTSILAILLLVQTLSSIIMEHYQNVLSGFLFLFTQMILSTGGNSSNQTSVLVIQGLATGEITKGNTKKFFGRELRMALVIGSILSAVSFIRIYFTNPGNFIQNLAVSISLGLVVIMSVTIGSTMPLLLKRFNLDPALSAGPILATMMDVLGIFLYCYVSKLILGI